MPEDDVSPEDGPATRARRGVPRILVRVLVGVLALVLVISGVVVWRVAAATQDLLTVKPRLWSSQVRVVSVDRRRITIAQVPGGPTWLTAGKVYGLTWRDGWGRVGAVIKDDGDRAVREFEVRGGKPPRDGVLARFSRESFPRDGRQAFPRAKVREVDVKGPDGPLPAWFAPGRGKTWAVLVHGRGSARSEMFRLMHDTVGLGMPSLAITYRGDPETGGGDIELGRTEWRDVESAVRLARSRGAKRVVLLGASMGGSLIAAFLERSDLAKDVAGLVLDAPLLDFDSAVLSAATKGRVPGFGIQVPAVLARAASQLAQWRSGLDFDDVDHLDDTSWLTVPALVLHGEYDDAVPVADSRRFAQAEPELVQLEVAPKAAHVESWNVEPAVYDRTVRRFLDALARDGRP